MRGLVCVTYFEYSIFVQFLKFYFPESLLYNTSADLERNYNWLLKSWIKNNILHCFILISHRLILLVVLLRRLRKKRHFFFDSFQSSFLIIEFISDWCIDFVHFSEICSSCFLSDMNARWIILNSQRGTLTLFNNF